VFRLYYYCINYSYYLYCFYDSCNFTCERSIYIIDSISMVLRSRAVLARLSLTIFCMSLYLPCTVSMTIVIEDVRGTSLALDLERSYIIVRFLR